MVLNGSGNTSNAAVGVSIASLLPLKIYALNCYQYVVVKIYLYTLLIFSQFYKWLNQKM